MTVEEQPHQALVEELASALRVHNRQLVTAESCTGGMLAAALTDIAGSSEWYYGGFVTYTEAAKCRLLGVKMNTIQRWGVVSEPTAREMALGALAHSSAQMSVAVTGIAGPTGGDIDRPTGTVWFAWALRDRELVHTAEHVFAGGRAAVRDGAVREALMGLLWLLDS